MICGVFISDLEIMEKPLLSNPKAPLTSYDSFKTPEETDSYTSALNKCDIGRYTLIKLLICGLAYLGAMSTILGVQFALPDVLFDFGITTDSHIISVVIVYAGVSIGAWFFGVCGDVIGRRPMIISLLSACAIFNFFSSVSRNFKEFKLYIAINCVCAGGTLPALWSYFIEFQMPVIANKLFCLLSLFWAFSYTVSAVIPKLVLDSCYGFTDSYGFALWRVRLLFSSFLALFPVILFTFSPESPELILASGDPKTSLTILQSIHAKNRSPNKMTTILIGEKQSENINLWMNSELSVSKASSCLKNHLREMPSNLKMSTVSLLLITGFGFYCSCYSTFIVLPELYKEIYSNNSSQSMTSLSPLLMPLPNKSITPSYLNETVPETCDKSFSNHFFVAGASIQQAIALSSILATFLWMPRSNGKIIIWTFFSTRFLKDSGGSDSFPIRH